MANKNPKIKLFLNPNEDKVTIRHDFESTLISSRQSVIIHLGEYRLEILGDGRYDLWHQSAGLTTLAEGQDIVLTLKKAKTS